MKRAAGGSPDEGGNASKKKGATSDAIAAAVAAATAAAEARHAQAVAALEAKASALEAKANALEATTRALADEKAAKIEAEYICSVCQDLLFDPVTSGCGHSLCYLCMISVCAHPPPCKCPTCRVPMERDASKWRINSAIAEALTANDGARFKAGARKRRLQAAFRAKDAKALVVLLTDYKKEDHDFPDKVRVGINGQELALSLVHAAATIKSDEYSEDLEKLFGKLKDLGANFDGDSALGSPLDISTSLGVSSALIMCGAKVCSIKAILNILHLHPPREAPYYAYYSGPQNYEIRRRFDCLRNCKCSILSFVSSRYSPELIKAHVNNTAVFRTALFSSLEAGDSQFTLSLIKAGASLNIKNEHGYSLL